MTFDRLREKTLWLVGLRIYILVATLGLTRRRPAELAEADENLIAKKRRREPREISFRTARGARLAKIVFPADNPTATMHQTETNYRA